MVASFLLFASIPYAQSSSQEELLKIVEAKNWNQLPETIISPVDGAEMALIPGGEFLMGIEGRSSLADKLPDAYPAHKVYLDPFYIDKYEVTNSQYKRFVQEKSAKSPLFSNDPNFNGPNQPVVGIRHGDASFYAWWAGKRLPTEAEWEKAARGSKALIYPWGNEFASSNCNAYPNGINRTVDVDRYPEGASPYGVMNMAGNAAEWIADYYDRDYYKNSPMKNPRGPSEERNARVVRGGDFKSDPLEVSAVMRDQAGEYSTFPNLGFRCVVSAEDLAYLFNPSLNKNGRTAASSGVTVIESNEDRSSEFFSPDRKNSFYKPETSESFEPVRYFRHLSFDGERITGEQPLTKSEAIGIANWKVYYNSPGIISQAHFYDRNDKIQIHIEPVYDEQGREKEVKVFDHQGTMVYVTRRIFEDGKPVEGVKYSGSGDFLGRERF